MYYVYILTNRHHTVLYIGVTNDLKRRLYEHQHDLSPGFSKRYQTHELIYFEGHDHPHQAISREKQLKGWMRKKKDALISTSNPNWTDLSQQVYEG